jgi:hypothetical protein
MSLLVSSAVLLSVRTARSPTFITIMGIPRAMRRCGPGPLGAAILAGMGVFSVAFVNLKLGTGKTTRLGPVPS